MCSHCPHYAKDGLTLDCWANHGAPKFWKYRPGPMSTSEKCFFLGGMAAVWIYPLPFLATSGRWLILVLFVLTSVGFFTALKRFFCCRYMNFACPFNTVDREVRDLFFRNNPSVAEHWSRPERVGG